MSAPTSMPDTVSSGTRQDTGKASRSNAAPPDSVGGNEQQIAYSAERIIGNGSFGVVFQAAVVGTGDIVAIKKVLQDNDSKIIIIIIIINFIRHRHRRCPTKNLFVV